MAAVQPDALLQLGTLGKFLAGNHHCSGLLAPGFYPVVIKNSLLENGPLISDIIFLTRTSIYRAFSIVMFDYQRVIGCFNLFVQLYLGCWFNFFWDGLKPPTSSSQRCPADGGTTKRRGILRDP